MARFHGHVDLLELRADFLREEELARAASLPRMVDLPVILTVRRSVEGGKWRGDERERVRLLERIGPAGFAFLDLEEDLRAPGLDEAMLASGAGIIRSLHDTNGVPADLARRMPLLARGAGEIPKAAVTPRGARDLLKLLEVFQIMGPVPKVLLGMGDFGFPTRILAPRLGTLFCYTSPPQESAAPGHIDPRTLDELFRYRNISSETEVFGIIGNPVMHSLSPEIHNRAFAALGRNAVYLPFLVDELGPFREVADRLNIRGLSVTVPYKEAVMPFLARLDQTATAVGACNTMRRGGDGQWEGTNTDEPGFLAPLASAFGGKVPAGLRATVIGAGGASRAVVHALVSHGAQVLVLNRSEARAGRLGREFGVQTAPLGSGVGLVAGFNDLIVQTTNVGMAPNTEQDPVPTYQFTGKEIVYDLIYAPQTTTFLNRAIEARCTVVRGGEMLLAQAFAQFLFFTGVAYPEEAKERLRIFSRFPS